MGLLGISFLAFIYMVLLESPWCLTVSLDRNDPNVCWRNITKTFYHSEKYISYDEDSFCKFMPIRRKCTSSRLCCGNTKTRTTASVQTVPMLECCEGFFRINNTCYDSRTATDLSSPLQSPRDKSFLFVICAAVLAVVIAAVAGTVIAVKRRKKSKKRIKAKSSSQRALVIADAATENPVYAIPNEDIPVVNRRERPEVPNANRHQHYDCHYEALDHSKMDTNFYGCMRTG